MNVAAFGLMAVTMLLPMSAMCANDSYLCITDMATGFSFDKQTKTWSVARFNTDRGKYVIAKPTADDLIPPTAKVTWVVRRVGNTGIHAYCENDFTEAGVIGCKHIGTEFRFNKTSLRFLGIYSIGYYSDNVGGDGLGFVEGNDTPSMEIGKCGRL